MNDIQKKPTSKKKKMRRECREEKKRGGLIDQKNPFFTHRRYRNLRGVVNHHRRKGKTETIRIKEKRGKGKRADLNLVTMQDGCCVLHSQRKGNGERGGKGEARETCENWKARTDFCSLLAVR